MEKTMFGNAIRGEAFEVTITTNEHPWLRKGERVTVQATSADVFVAKKGEGEYFLYESQFER